MIVVDEEKDTQAGAAAGPSRGEIADLIRRTVNRDPVTDELVDRIDALFRPRSGRGTRKIETARLRLQDLDFVAMVDDAARDLAKKPADTRALTYRLAIQNDTDDATTIKDAVRDDLQRESAPRKTIRGRVTDELSGKPIAGAVVASISGMIARTDDRGFYVLKTRPPKSTNPMILTIEAPGYALTQTYLAWEELEDVTVSDHRLPRALTFGGQVVDEAKKPIAGATLELWIHNEAICRDGSMQKVNFNSTTILRARTDAAGLYLFRNMPRDLPDRVCAISLSVSHPKYQSRQKQYQPNEELGEGWQITLEPGAEIRGTVTDESGKPLADCPVRLTSGMPLGPAEPPIRTDAEGRFAVHGLPEARIVVTATPKDHLPNAVIVPRVTRAAPTDLTIKVAQGEFLQGRVVGEDGQPAKQAMVGWARPVNTAPNARKSFQVAENVGKAVP